MPTLTEIQTTRDQTNTDCEKIEFSEANIVIYKQFRGKEVILRGYEGRKQKHSFYYRFSNEEKSDAYTEKVVFAAMTKENDKQQRKDFSHTLKIDDILFSSYGYDQTNIDYYQVVGVKNKSVVLRELRAITEYDNHSMTGTCVPHIGLFKNSNEITKRVSIGNRIKLTSYSHASPLSYEVTHGIRIYKTSRYSTYG